jgi:3,4-dihydroxy 2-butanone 4-phosphate synthase/GTP cyclohydrolase II
MQPKFKRSPEVEVSLVLPGEKTQSIRVLISAYDLGDRGGPDRYIVLHCGTLRDGAYVRIESACLGHLFGLARCDCYDQLTMALHELRHRENYVLIYAYDQDGRGNGPLEHLAAIKKMDEEGIPLAKVYPQRDKRQYQNVAFLIKRLLGLSTIKLFTNNPDRISDLGSFGLNVERAAFEASPRPESAAVLRWKKELEGHLLDLP